MLLKTSKATWAVLLPSLLLRRTCCKNHGANGLTEKMRYVDDDDG
jgi:hypothetical protein